MVPLTTRPRIALAVLFVALLILASGGVYALPFVSNGTGPTDAAVVDLERLETGCADDVDSFRHTQTGANGTFTHTGFVETGSADGSISAWVERTSPPGADLGTFRVHVDSDNKADQTDCQIGVRYRVDIQTSGGVPDGLVPDADGVRVLWLENGAVSGCSSAVESPLDAECGHFLTDEPRRTWANTTSG